ncbi:MAG: hypothetical protein KME45_09420 [Stenomitos rutilans HA7619-LM2]|jgi:hypothetical protein|nr:hypothetical protein [Stenomitos rutilans HA7619-LM2]
MSPVERVQFDLEALKTQRAQVVEEGWFLQHCWLVQVKPGGTAQTNCKYWQVRSRQPLFNGKTLKHLKAHEVEAYSAAIARGRQLKQIDRQIEKLQKQLGQQTAKTDVLGRSFALTAQEPPLPVPMLVGGHPRSEAAAIQPLTLEAIDATEQERLVKEVLASSRELRASLRQSVALCRQLGARNVNLRNGYPHIR